MFTIDFTDDMAIGWELTAEGARPIRDTSYRPRIYVGVRTGQRAPLEVLADSLANDPKVEALTWSDKRTDLASETPSTLLAIDLERIDEVTTLAREIRTYHEADRYAPGTYELYNVDFSPQFRYCLETGTDPTPSRPLEVVELTLPEPAIANEDLTALELDGELIDGADPRRVLEAVTRTLASVDPDVLLVSSAQVIPTLYAVAATHGVESFQLGRAPGWEQLAAASTFESYGRVGYSPARYNVPGRAIVDRSTSFMYGEAGLAGICDLVNRSWKPLQEAAWASIGNLLTAMQIREATRRDIVIPWHKSRPEQFKSVETHHIADRGGFTFEPEVGLHEDVYALDFSSLYPNIMIEYNISPETIRCGCNRHHETVPELGYTICERDGFIPDVLEPIVEDRDEIKAQLAEADDPEHQQHLSEQSEALKWILVTCFGYQGYKNSKFGTIEAHEAINAYARDILLTAKEHLERAGWHIVHGIVDSVWVTPKAGVDQTPLATVAEAITDTVGIRLEREEHFEWICFLPQRNSQAGALTKYFGKIADEEAFKIRGIERRQRNTPPFIAEAQQAYLEVLDRTRSGEAVCHRFQQHRQRLREMAVDPAALTIRTRCSKPIEGYSQETMTVAALARYRDHGIEKTPGQDVRYVVVDRNGRLADRVRLPFEDCPGYDVAFYETALCRACESVISPLGWRETDIERFLRERETVDLSAFT